MQICKTCILPETYPEITFDQNGVCNFCNRGSGDKKDENKHFNNEAEVIEAFSKFRKPGAKYDVLVSLSGGVDSSFTLIQMKERYKLNPLVWHNDHGYEHETATANVKKLCKALNVDLVILQQDLLFMKKFWKFVIENPLGSASSCFLCANILFWNAIELAERYGIKIIVNGYSKGQVGLNKQKGRQLIKILIENMLAKNEIDLFEEFMKKYEMASKHKTYETREDLLEEADPERILVVPFFIFKFYKTDKAQLKKMCQERFNWQELDIPYPARTTNCIMNWLNTYVDLQRVNYSVYTEEYAGLVREGEITRQQALDDLAFNPPPGLLKKLAKEIGMDWETISNKEI